MCVFNVTSTHTPPPPPPTLTLPPFPTTPKTVSTIHSYPQPHLLAPPPFPAPALHLLETHQPCRTKPKISQPCLKLKRWTRISHHENSPVGRINPLSFYRINFYSVVKLRLRTTVPWNKTPTLPVPAVFTYLSPFHPTPIHPISQCCYPSPVLSKPSKS